MSLAQELHDAGDFEQARRRLAEMINLAPPAAAAVTRRALLDKQFAIYLMLTKDSPDLQRRLLDDPRTRDYDDEAAGEGVSAATEVAPLTGAKLLGKASKAYLKWGKTGFRAMDDAQREKRWAACQACRYLVDPPQTILYQGLRLLTGGETKICSACGCAANKKVAIPTEHCPVRSEIDHDLSRWGEPWHAG